MDHSLPTPTPHSPRTELLDQARAQVAAHLSLRPRYDITDACQQVAAGLLASAWTWAEGHGFTRDDLRGAVDLPSVCLSLASTQIRRAGYVATIDARTSPTVS